MKQIRSHTGLRGIAAILVVFYHLQYQQPHLAFEDATAFFQRSYLMVDLFFILSGFIISYVYTPAATRLAWSGFMAKRVFRLYPLHLFCLTYLVLGTVILTAGLRAVGAHVESPWSGLAVAQLASQIFLINAYMPFENGWNIPTWSISAELFAYALFPYLAWVLRGRGAIAGVTLGLSLLFYLVVAGTGGSLDITYLTAPLRCLAGFGLGMLVYRHRGVVDDLPPVALAIGQAGGLVWSLGVLILPCNDVLAIPGFVALVALTASDRGWLSHGLSSRPFQYLGDISYSVYLNHTCVGVLLYRPWLIVTTRMSLDPATERAAYIGLLLAIVLAMSHFTHRRVELPAQRHLNRRYAGRRAMARTGRQVTPVPHPARHRNGAR